MRRGVAAVELALTLPIVVMLTSAVIDYGLFLRSLATVNNAVREGARAGVRVPAGADPSPETIALVNVQRVLVDAGFVDRAAAHTDAVLLPVGDTTSLVITVSIPFTPVVGLLPTPPPPPPR